MSLSKRGNEELIPFGWIPLSALRLLLLRLLAQHFQLQPPFFGGME
jgi:hypothetical protein